MMDKASVDMLDSAFDGLRGADIVGKLLFSEGVYLLFPLHNLLPLLLQLTHWKIGVSFSPSTFPPCAGR